MSDHANKNFLAQPATWLRNNLLIVDIQTNIQGTRTGTGASEVRGSVETYTTGAIVTVNIVADPARYARRTGGGQVPAFRVKEATGAASKYSHRFQAYYLPFRSNAIRTMRLDPATFPPGANFFFTDTVNGCSFAAGPGANPKVGHFNRTVGGDDSAGIDQPAMNNDIGLEFAGGTDVKLTRATYKATTADYASVIGIKNIGGWNFYWQGPRTWVGFINNEKEYQVPANMIHQCDNFG